MQLKINSRKVRQEFRAIWADRCALIPPLARDKPAQREAFAVFVDHLHREGRISDRVAQGVTLEPRRRVYSWEVQADYGHGWECLCSGTFAEARSDLKDYKANAPGIPYRLRRVAELVEG